MQRFSNAMFGTPTDTITGAYLKPPGAYRNRNAYTKPCTQLQCPCSMVPIGILQ